VVECLHALYSKFPAESGSERIFKIGLDLTKLLPKFRGFVFLEHGVVSKIKSQCRRIFNDRRVRKWDKKERRDVM